MKPAEWAAVGLQAFGALLVLASFGYNAFFLDRVLNVEGDIRDRMLVNEMQLTIIGLGDGLREEIRMSNDEAKAKLQEARELRSYISTLTGSLFALGSLLTISGFVLEKWRK